MNYLFKAIIRHCIIFSLITIGFVLFVFINSLSNDIHPDAYKDAIMSVVYVYGAFLIVYIPYVLIMNKTKFKDSRFAFKIKAWHNQSTLFDHIAIWFTMITVINSIMMLTGIDVPKQGTFAYVHLLIRLLIITLAVCLYMAKYIIEQIKVMKTRKPTFKMNIFLKNIINHSLISTFKLFTIFTVVFCLINISLQSYIHPKGGAAFYTLLLIVFAGLLVISMIHSIYKRYKVRDKQL